MLYPQLGVRALSRAAGAEEQIALTIPESAIEFSGDSTFVNVLVGSGDKNTYERRPVTTGLSDGVNIEIKKGLTTKDKVRGPEVNAEDKED